MLLFLFKVNVDERHNMYDSEEHKGDVITHTPLKAYEHDDEKFADAACLGGGEFVDMSKMRTKKKRGKSKKTSSGKRSRKQGKKKPSKKTPGKRARKRKNPVTKPGGQSKRKKRKKS